MEAEALSRLSRRNQVKNSFKHLVKDIPFLILLLNGISILILSRAEPIDYDAPDAKEQYINHMNEYDWIYSLVSEFSDFSLPLVCFMAFYAYTHRYCLYSWVCIGGLGLLNVLNLLHYFLNFDYVQSYAGIVVCVCLVFALIYKLKK